MSEVRSFLDVNGRIAARLPQYEARPEQLELGLAIESAIREGRHLLAEAGTGIGKSFAYLVPAVLEACRDRDAGPVIVSTRTIALQAQLEHKDLPFLQAVMPLEWSAVTAVGRNHYLCLRRMHLANGERGLLFPDLEKEAQLARLVDWSMQTLDGTRLSLDPPVDDQVWDEVKAEHGNCLHKACPHYEPCHYQRSRRRMAQAEILVVNHALYMADLALRMAGASYLPEHQLVIFDEAHHLERVATESLGLRISLGSVLWQLRRLLPKRGKGLLASHGSQSSLELVEVLRGTAHDFFTVLENRVQSSGSATLALGEEVIEQNLSHLLELLSEELLGIAMGMSKVDLRMEMQARARGIDGLRVAMDALCAPRPRSDTESVEMVRWIEAGRRSPELRSAPLEVSQALGQALFAERSAVLVSATLGTPSDPDYSAVRRKLGIGEAQCLRLGSPFDYARQVRLEVPEAVPDPVQDAKGYLRSCCDLVRDAVLENGGRALILCTSWNFVHELSGVLRPELMAADIELLVQGETTLRNLLEQKRSDPSSVLIGTESLWEGIDLPGEVLTLLVITRLPFAQPDHPLTRARLARIRARGGSPFAEHSLPEAVLRFRQGFGRLVRRKEDQGRVLILDPRLRTRSYGREFIRSLPDGLQPDQF
ncbi:MAG: ATP-dependent DNA helicase [Planctomycetota bacterium]|jgi:ATP-dependent DNA helicase DinG